ncbi:winged helix-turn-helix domain-containing protein [Aliiglaciecola lipolytica]|uniref:Cytoplasmic protein n=1 Tax=Aliiglaciecola lipolytica E3 TaxID=1127673 RepID=K6Y839_9ALTE|nr:crosslink repair DNA glycosylase YcaQ family protein [Aliiglaciecola lipolytica]GAC12798.1 hypothetical protein GLIP_0143 [Aliiglaciecola lipolytica E3]
MDAQHISLSEARKLAIVSQGLHKVNPFGYGTKGVLSALQQLSYVQIDTISVVERAHHHSFWSRVNDYSVDMLALLMKDKQIFEYWSHAAAYLPIEDYRFSLPRKQAFAGGDKHWHTKDVKLNHEILQRISYEGPLRAKDFERSGGEKSSGWWDWKPAKKALEQLFMEGKVMTIERRGFQKVYDLTERALPADTNTIPPTDEEFFRYLITRCLQANGLATLSEITYLRKGIKAKVARQCTEMLENNELRLLKCEGQYYYALPNSNNLLRSQIKRSQVKILSPFDNLLIQRKRILQLFGFDYQIECYLPQTKRKYGYFSLPLLWADNFAGRMDAKIDRKTGRLHIQHLHIETSKIEAFLQAFLPTLKAFLTFNQGDSIELKRLTSAHSLSTQHAITYQQQIEKLHF